jgi:hypothetical protein
MTGQSPNNADADSKRAAITRPRRPASGTEVRVGVPGIRLLPLLPSMSFATAVCSSMACRRGPGPNTQYFAGGRDAQASRNFGTSAPKPA